MTIAALADEARRLAKQDAEDIVRMVERQEREWQRVSDAFEQINREMAEHMLRIIGEMPNGIVKLR